MANKIQTVNRWPLYTANKAEQNAFKKLYATRREAEHPLYFNGSYRQFRKRILYDSLNGCFRLICNGIYIGIEKDGYTHT